MACDTYKSQNNEEVVPAQSLIDLSAHIDPQADQKESQAEEDAMYNIDSISSILGGRERRTQSQIHAIACFVRSSASDSVP